MVSYFWCPSEERQRVKNVRFILAGVAAVAAAATVITGILLGTTGAIVVGTLGILATLLAVAFVIVKSIQVVLQRLSGGQKQYQRIKPILGSVHYKVDHQKIAFDQHIAQIRSKLDELGDVQEMQLEQTEVRDLLAQLVQLLESRALQAGKQRPEDLTWRLKEAFAGDSEIEFTKESREGETR